MTTKLDHLIVPVNDAVNDAAISADFYAQVLGFSREAPDPPFEVVRVNTELTLLLGQWGTRGGMHLAFSMSPREFNEAFERVRLAGLPWGAPSTPLERKTAQASRWGHKAQRHHSTSSTPMSTSSRSGTTEAFQHSAYGVLSWSCPAPEEWPAQAVIADLCGAENLSCKSRGAAGSLDSPLNTAEVVSIDQMLCDVIECQPWGMMQP